MPTQVSRWRFFALCLAAVSFISLPALAQTVGPNGKIAYVVNMGFPDYTTDIWVMDADGSNQINLTNTPSVSEYGPVWSPDGTRIAYVVGDGIAAGVWVMNADGSGQVKLSTFSGSEFGPTWSADGSQIALVRYVPGIAISIQFDVFVVAVDGSSDVNITNSDFDELEPAWSPDGNKIAFAGVREGGTFTTWQIVTVNPDGTGEADLIVMDEENRSPQWSPDSTMITFMSQFNNPCCGTWQVWAMNSDGTGATNLSNDPTVYDMWPSWSPDGTLIIFSSTRNGGCCGETNIFSMPAPTHLPPGGQGAMSQAGLKQLTTNGTSTDPDWGKKPSSVCKTNCLRSTGIVFNYRLNNAGIDLRGRVQVKNELGAVVPDSSVSIQWTLPDSRVRNAQTLTDANGMADFQIKGPHGTYVLTVRNITKPGYSFDLSGSLRSKSIRK